MSDSESDAFVVDDSDSDAFVAPTKAAAKAKKAPGAPAAKKAAASSSKTTSTTKAAPKKTAAKKVPLATKKPSNESISEDEDSDVSVDSTTAKARRQAEDKEFEDREVAGRKAIAGKGASEVYQKLSQREHVLVRPDTYIGSIEAITAPMWVFDTATNMMVNRPVTYVPGFFKIFDEILVNAADNKINDPTMDTLKITIDREKKQISVFNNGRGIPIEMHKKEGIMIPELIFGNLLTSSNYDDDQKKLTGGRNGYGAKLTNIYSTEFIVETADKTNEKKYKQVFSENMSKTGKPKITANPKGEEYTKITYTPELERFGMTSIDDDTYALMAKRVYDMAGTVKDIKVHLNGERIKVKGFKQYVEMYLKAATQAQEEAAGGAAVVKPTLVHEIVNKRWEVAFALSNGEPQQVSFANSIATTKGGTHVDMIATSLANKLLEQIKKKNKAAPVKPFQVKNHMWIFVNALIENPAFDSQTKETLTLKSSQFGSKCELSEDFVKKVAKSGIIDNVLNWAKFKQDQMMKKMDGSKRSRISGIVKLEDANNAGGRNAKRCTLILTEGDSAKALAVSGLGVVGRDDYGVFPLRGKLLNVRDANLDQILKNTEIGHIRQILGLKHGKVYTSTDSLRYGHLMIMTDQDHDGSHIKGLIINFLDHYYPDLMRIPGFLVEFITPIVKTWKGKKELTFYTLPQYETWKAENNDGKGWQYKYYKGLGTSTSADAKKYFSALERHRLGFEAMTPDDRALIDMAFNKKKADDRKEWLRQFRPGTFLDHDVKSIPVCDFVNKELILFSMADNIRSIPSVADGLKPGQRKVMFACFKRNLRTEIKVAQLAGYVSEKTAYHHGEQSLTMTIVGLAQNFVGSNNINLLEPNGQFGTRIAGGKDAASARYIFTNVPKITRTIFHPHDDPILKYLDEDGAKIEPEYYLPTVPLVLINGAEGIGTGWSTSIPNFNPIEIVENLRRLMRGEEPERMNPWFRGFRGSIERVEQDRYKSSGIVEKVDDKTLDITELPIRTWTQNFKEGLEEMTSGGNDKVPQTIKDYEEHHTDTTVHFRLHMTEDNVRKAEEEGLEKRFKLSSTFNTSNMVCFDLNSKIKKYSSAEEILVDFYHKRLEYYGLRKQHLADELSNEFERLSNQARFVQMIIAKELVVSNKKKSAIVSELRDLKFKPIPKVAKAKEEGETEPAVEDEEGEDGDGNDFDYLLGMRIYSLTKERVDKLLAERDVKENELIELLKLTPQTIWNNDLDAFLKEWEAMLESDIAAAKGSKPKTKAAIKAAQKKKKRAEGDDSDESDFYEPTKAASKPRAPAKPKAASLVKDSPAKASSTQTSPIKRDSTAVSDDSDAGTQKPPAKKAAVAKSKAKAPAKKIETVMELDDEPDDDMYTIEDDKSPVRAAVKANGKKTVDPDDSDDEPIKPKAKPKAKAPPKKKAKDVLGDSEDEKPIVPKAKAAAKPKAAPKKKAKVDSDEGEDDDVDMSASESDVPIVKPKKATAKSKKKDDSDFDDDFEQDDFVPTPRPVVARTGRAATKKPAYVDMSDEDDD